MFFRDTTMTQEEARAYLLSLGITGDASAERAVANGEMSEEEFKRRGQMRAAPNRGSDGTWTQAGSGWDGQTRADDPLIDEHGRAIDHDTMGAYSGRKFSDGLDVAGRPYGSPGRDIPTSDIDFDAPGRRPGPIPASQFGQPRPPRPTSYQYGAPVRPGETTYAGGSVVEPIDYLRAYREGAPTLALNRYGTPSNPYQRASAFGQGGR